MTEPQTKTTHCKKCGRELQYTTKRPLLCADCKKPRKKNKRIPGGSKEALMFALLDTIMPGQYYIRNGYYSFLISPKGAPMQFDIYFPEFKLAWEYDGRQHSEYNEFMHKSKKAFRYLQQCDQIKNELCKELGITLIRIRFDKKLTADYLRVKLQEANPELYNKLLTLGILRI